MSPKQTRFVAEYLIDLNATQAAIRAGYSARVANREGSRLLSNADISAAIAEAQRAQNQRLLLTADEAREQNAFIARLDPAELFDENGGLLHVTKMPRRVRCALKSIKVVRKNLTSGDGVMDTTLEVQFWDKNTAIGREYQFHGLLVDRVHVTGELEVVSSRLVAARKRLAERQGGELVMPLQRFVRLQEVLRRTVESFDRRGLSGDPDDVFMEKLRDSTLAAGATESEFEAVGALLVRVVLGSTVADSEERVARLELIAEHFMRSDMGVAIGKDDGRVRVAFPGRPRVQ
jgi:phage terminase small subunit